MDALTTFLAELLVASIIANGFLAVTVRQLLTRPTESDLASLASQIGDRLIAADRERAA